MYIYYMIIPGKLSTPFEINFVPLQDFPLFFVSWPELEWNEKKKEKF